LIKCIYNIAKKAELLTPVKITEIIDKVEEFERIVKLDCSVRIDGSKRTRFIGSWKMHILHHIVAFIIVWGSIGLWDEQMIENSHQVYRPFYQAMQNLKGERRMESLCDRLNTAHSKVNPKVS